MSLQAAVALARAWPLDGATNFRDLGGYKGLDGRPVRWRRLFRSDHLGALTERDHAVLSGAGVRRVVDFRGVAERDGTVARMPGAQVHSLPIEPTVVQRLSALLGAGHPLTPQETVAVMQQTYRGFARESAPRFAALFEHLLASDEPLVFHCTAGKDRTGFAAALILLALGVSRDEVMHDYLLTNSCLRVAPGRHATVPPEILAVLYRVQEDFLHAAMDAVEQDHGSVDAYLAGALGLDAQRRARLAALYLES